MNERIPGLGLRFRPGERRISPPRPGVMPRPSDDGRLHQGSPTVRDPCLTRFLQGWLRFRGERTMPRRQDIDPFAFPDLLARIYLYERQAGGDSFRCVLAGEEIHRAWNGPIMGRDVADLFSAADLPRVLARWSFVLDRPAALYGYHRDPATSASAERLLLPVSDDAGAGRFVFGATAYQRDLTDAGSGITPPPEVLFYALSGLSAEAPDAR